MSVGKIIRMKFISREMLQKNRNTIFVFGDNMARVGLGGQAKAMRGEPNAVGVPTKWRPGRAESDYFTDADADNIEVLRAINKAFHDILAALKAGHNVVIPADGLGTGLAELPTRAARVHAVIEAGIHGLERFVSESQL